MATGEKNELDTINWQPSSFQHVLLTLSIRHMRVNRLIIFFCMQNVYVSDALQHAKGYDYFGWLIHWSGGFRHGFRSTTFAI